MEGEIILKKRFGYKNLLTLLMTFLFVVSPLQAVADATTEAATMGNLLSNPDFETADSNGKAVQWDRYGNAAFDLVSSTVSNGFQAQRIEASNIPSGQFVAISQRMSVTPEQRYLLSGRLRVEQLSGAVVQLYVDFYNGDRYLAAQSLSLPTETTSDYVTASGEVRVPASASAIRIYALVRSNSSAGSATIYVDAMSFKHAGTQEQNLLANADFRSEMVTSKSINDWSSIQSGNSQISAVTMQVGTGSDKRAAKIVASNMPTNQFTAVYQIVRVTPGQTINMSTVLNVTSLTNASVYLYADYFNGPTYISSKVYEVPAMTQGSYVTLSGYGEVPSNASYIVVYVMIKSTSADGAGTVYVDHINLQYSHDNNQLANGDLDTVSPSSLAAYWQKSEYAGTTEYSTIRTGGNTIQKVSATALTSNAFSGISQLLKVQPAQPYSVSGRINVEALSNAKVQLYTDYYGANLTSIGADYIDFPTTTNQRFVTISNSITTPATAAYMRVYILIRGTGLNGAGVVLIDDVRSSLTTNLLSNPSFERGTSPEATASWSEAKQSAVIMGDSSLVNAPHPENKRLYIYTATGAMKRISQYKNGVSTHTFFKYDSNGNLIKKIGKQSTFNNQTVYHGQQSQRVSGFWIPNGQFYSMYQSLVVKPNKAFQQSSNINIELLHNAKVQIYIDFFNASGNIVGSLSHDCTGVPGQYATQQFNGMTPSNAVTATIHFLIRSTGNDGGGIFYVDNASMTYPTV